MNDPDDKLTKLMQPTERPIVASAPTSPFLDSGYIRFLQRYYPHLYAELTAGKGSGDREGQGHE